MLQHIFWEKCTKTESVFFLFINILCVKFHVIPFCRYWDMWIIKSTKVNAISRLPIELFVDNLNQCIILQQISFVLNFVEYHCINTETWVCLIFWKNNSAVPSWVRPSRTEWMMFFIINILFNEFCVVPWNRSRNMTAPIIERKTS